MFIQGQVGPQRANDGDNNKVARMGKDTDLIVTELHAKYYEQAYRGNLFIQDSDSVTLAAANTTKGAAGTIKLINGILNPAGSGKNIVILGALVSLVSGTATGGFAYNATTLPAGSGLSNAATGQIRAAVVNTVNPAGTTVAVAETGVVITRTDALTTAFTQIGQVGGPAAIAAGAGINSVYDPVDGKIVIPPGCVFGLTQVGASTAVVQSTLYWEEVPV